MSNNIVKQQGADLAVINDDLLNIMAQDANLGAEESDKDSYSIPYIIILQAMSPIVLDNAGDNPDFVAGRFYNNVSKITFKDFEFIPCHFQRRFVRWEKDAPAGGASFQGIYTPAELNALISTGQAAKNDENRYEITDGQGTGVFIDTRLHYVLYHNVDADTWEPAIISLSKSQVKHSKRLMTLIRTIQFKVNGKVINPPSWANVYKATVAKEKNEQGQWFGWSFARVGVVKDADIYQLAKSIHDSVIEGQLSASAPIDEDNGDKPDAKVPHYDHDSDEDAF